MGQPALGSAITLVTSSILLICCLSGAPSDLALQLCTLGQVWLGGNRLFPGPNGPAYFMLTYSPGTTLLPLELLHVWLFGRTVSASVNPGQVVAGW